MASRLSVVLDPARMQSQMDRHGWFEGWYFKLVDAEARQAMAIIPGVARDMQGQASHCFVQVLRPGHPVRYERFDFEAFSSAEDRFDISLAGNHFSAEGLLIDLPETAEHPAVVGAVDFGPWRTWPVSVLSPGAMGWYRYVPRMECYHGILSLDHALAGSLAFGEETLCFDGGRGYAEKDWGHSFPSSWVWLQSNHFVDDEGRARPGVSLTTSIARIPWLHASFTGHIIGLALDDGTLLRFATYTGARLRTIETSPGHVAAVVSDSRYELLVVAQGGSTGELKAPTKGEMSARDDESLDGHVRIELRDRRDGDRLVLGATGSCTALEVMNDRDELKPG